MGSGQASTRLADGPPQTSWAGVVVLTATADTGRLSSQDRASCYASNTSPRGIPAEVPASGTREQRRVHRSYRLASQRLDGLARPTVTLVWCVGSPVLYRQTHRGQSVWCCGTAA